MTRSLSVASCGLWALAMLVGGCFADATQQSECTPGMEGCMCVELQCEQGLVCMSGVCIPEGGTGSTTTNPTTDPTNVTGVTTTDPSTTSPTTGPGSTSSTTSVDDSSSGDTSTETGSESSGSTGEPSVCGDYELADDEECDQDNFCTDCELDNHACNPLNNHPCPKDRKCSFTVVSQDPFEANYTCVVKQDMLLDIDQANCFIGGDAADEACREGLGCLDASVLSDCPSGQGCCTEYCNLDLPEDMQCTNPDYTCQHEDFVLAGLESLGICRL